MQMFSVILILLLAACSANPVDNPAFYATKAAKPKTIKSLITPGFK